MAVPLACLKGDRHGQSKEARCAAQEELETRQGKRQACAQARGKTGDAKEGEVEGQAHGSEREQPCRQEEAVTGAGKDKAGRGDARRTDTHRRDRRAGSWRGRCYGARVGSVATSISTDV